MTVGGQWRLRIVELVDLQLPELWQCSGHPEGCWSEEMRALRPLFGRHECRAF